MLVSSAKKVGFTYFTESSQFLYISKLIVCVFVYLCSVLCMCSVKSDFMYFWLMTFSVLWCISDIEFIAMADCIQTEVQSLK